MARPIRIYHPDHVVSWTERVLDLFSGRHGPRPEPGVDYSLVHRTAARSARAILDHLLAITLLGDEMVRVDTRWAPPPQTPLESVAAVVARLRFAQLAPGAGRTPLGIRWVELVEAPHGATLLIRLLEAPDPGLRSVLEANLAEGGPAEWTEFAVAQD